MDQAAQDTPQQPISSTSEFSHFFEVKTPIFDGPIDLLLQLVKSRELPIERMSLAEVASQYLATVERIRKFDLEVAGEYLVIAATLVSIKSSILLNDPVQMIEDEDGNLVDPHQELLNKLREAAVYKEGAFKLSCRKILGYDVFQAPSSLGGYDAFPAPLKEHDPFLLGKAFRKLLEKLPQELLFTISVDSVTIVERMMKIVEILKTTSSPMKFDDLVTDRTSRGSIIGAFLALLELSKRQMIAIRQDEQFDEIYVGLAGDTPMAIVLESEFDAPVSDEKVVGDA